MAGFCPNLPLQIQEEDLKLMSAYAITGTSWLFFSASLGGIIFSLILQMWQLRLREMRWPSVSPTANHSYLEAAAGYPVYKKTASSPSHPQPAYPNSEPGSEGKTMQSTLLLSPFEVQFSYPGQPGPLVFFSYRDRKPKVKLKEVSEIIQPTPISIKGNWGPGL